MAFKKIETSKEQDFYSCLSSDTKLNADVGSKCWETDTGNVFESYGLGWSQAGTDGAAHTKKYDEPLGFSRDRRYAGAAATRQKFTWATPVYKIIVTVFPIEAAIKITFNAVTDAQADANLVDTAGEAVDIQYKRVGNDADTTTFQPTVREFTFDPSGSGLTRLDYITEAGTVTEVIVEATDAG